MVFPHEPPAATALMIRLLIAFRFPGKDLGFTQARTAGYGNFFLTKILIRMSLLQRIMIVVVTTPTNKTKPMKIPSTTTFAALAAFTAIPAAFAQDATEPVLPEVSICIAYPVEEFTEEFTKEFIEEPTEEYTEEPTEEFTDETTEEFTEETTEEFTEETTDDEVVEINPEEGEGIVTVGGWPEGGVPIEWVKRGGGELDNPDVIFYSMAGGPALQNMAGGPSPEADPSTGGTAARVLNQGETASDIENNVTSGAGVAKVAKKSTVAIVKQGRVFLR